MMPKQGITPEGYFEYTVYPLEGIWTIAEEETKFDKNNKDALVYRIMIRQPDYITTEVFDMALAAAKKKKPSIFLNDALFEEIEDGKCVQMMHFGSHDDEPETFIQMDKFIEETNYERLSKKHREIYITDTRKTELSQLKTVLRYCVK